MGLFSKNSADKQEIQDARAELEAVSKRDKSETQDYLRANRRVAEAEGNRSWWMR